MVEIYKSEDSLIRICKEGADYSFLPGGGIHEFSKSHFVITQIPAGVTEEPVGNIYLRIWQEDGTRTVYPLCGAGRRMKVWESGLSYESEAEGIHCRVTFCPADTDFLEGENASVWI